MTAAARKRSSPDGQTRSLAKEHFQQLLDLLWQRWLSRHRPHGRAGSDHLRRSRVADDLPRGWTDEQSGGTLSAEAPRRRRLVRLRRGAAFVEAVSLSAASHRGRSRPHRRAAGSCATAATTSRPMRFSACGPASWRPSPCRIARSCTGQYVDPIYRRRRERALIIAVNCTQAASTCFCTSMNTGPRCTQRLRPGADRIARGLHRRSRQPARGGRVVAVTHHGRRSQKHSNRPTAARQQAVDQITKRLDTTDIRDLLLDNLEHPRWDEVATRCLSCTNCTMVCPTCFCSSVDEVSDLTGEHVERERQWDSCFNFDFSYMNGGVVRNQIRSRYRQWLTHKLASWIDQFDVSGCVGCGRCITWCPVGIDLTEEVAAIRENPS